MIGYKVSALSPYSYVPSELPEYPLKLSARLDRRIKEQKERRKMEKERGLNMSLTCSSTVSDLFRYFMLYRILTSVTWVKEHRQMLKEKKTTSIWFWHSGERLY